MAPPSPEPDASDAVEDPPCAGARPRRRLLPLLLLIGALIVGAPLLESMGDQRDVVIRIDQPAQVTAISVVLRDGDTALWGTERHFEAGAAPTAFQRTLPLPAGRYELSVDLVAGGRDRTIERHLDVPDDASAVVVPIVAPSP